MVNKPKEMRTENNLTQEQVSELVKMPLRTYIRYENEDKYIGSFKYEKLLDILEEKFQITEEKGIQRIETIIEVVNDIFKEYDIDFCYLFGSYAKAKQTEISDIDLCISGNVTGLAIFGLVEKLRVCK